MAESEQTAGEGQAEPQDQEQKPKIIADDDWKAQARAEKERLAKEVEGGAEEGGPAAGRRAGGPRELPPVSFATLINSLVAQCYYCLGGMEDPETKRRYVDLDLAKHHIDTLALLEEKTKGNLTDEERRLLDHALYETRMQYVNLAQRLQSM